MTHTEVPERVKASILKLEVEFRHQGAFLRIPFWGHISAADHAIFTKVGCWGAVTCAVVQICFLQKLKMADGCRIQ